jgi:hypothetical protein
LSALWKTGGRVSAALFLLPRTERKLIVTGKKVGAGDGRSAETGCVLMVYGRPAAG